MPYGYSSGRRRSYRRKMPSRRYTGSRLAVPRYQFNDSERRIMSFTSTTPLDIVFAAGTSAYYAERPFANIMSENVGSPNVTTASGRIFYAGMMYDRMRLISLQVELRTMIMPSTAENLAFWASWDRYYDDTEPASSTRTVTDDPSARMVIWSQGGSSSALRMSLGAVGTDRFQYLPIQHNAALTSWFIQAANGQVQTGALNPVLRMALLLASTPAIPGGIRLYVQSRYTVEFSGAFSSATGNDF